MTSRTMYVHPRGASQFVGEGTIRFAFRAPGTAGRLFLCGQRCGWISCRAPPPGFPVIRPRRALTKAFRQLSQAARRPPPKRFSADRRRKLPMLTTLANFSSRGRKPRSFQMPFINLGLVPEFGSVPCLASRLARTPPCPSEFDFLAWDSFPAPRGRGAWSPLLDPSPCLTRNLLAMATQTAQQLAGETTGSRCRPCQEASGSGPAGASKLEPAMLAPRTRPMSVRAALAGRQGSTDGVPREAKPDVTKVPREP